jgi:hypothetical protein
MGFSNPTWWSISTHHCWAEIAPTTEWVSDKCMPLSAANELKRFHTYHAKQVVSNWWSCSNHQEAGWRPFASTHAYRYFLGIK